MTRAPELAQVILRLMAHRRQGNYRILPISRCRECANFLECSRVHRRSLGWSCGCDRHACFWRDDDYRECGLPQQLLRCAREPSHTAAGTDAVLDNSRHRGASDESSGESTFLPGPRQIRMETTKPTKRGLSKLSSRVPPRDPWDPKTSKRLAIR